MPFNLTTRGQLVSRPNAKLKQRKLLLDVKVYRKDVLSIHSEIVLDTLQCSMNSILVIYSDIRSNQLDFSSGGMG